MNRRTFALLLALLMLVSVGFGLAPRAVSAQAPVRPTISAKVGEKTVRGLLGSYCWPDDKGTPQCDVVDEPDPKSQIDIALGGTISFIIDPVAANESFKVVLLDDLDAQGQPTIISNPANTLDYVIPATLKTGVRRLQVQMVYPADAKGNQPFVYYAFLINVTAASAATSQAIAAAPTNATLSATTNGTAPTSAATVSPAQPGTLAPSMVEPMTPAATVSALGTAGAPSMTEPMTPAATSAAPPSGATEQATATAASTDLSTIIAPTVEATIEATSLPTASATLEATQVATAVPTTAATALPTIAATATPQATAAPTAAVPSLESTVPQMLLLVASNSYRPIAIESCKLDAAAASGQTCTSSAISANTPVPQAARDADVLFIFKGPAPDQTIVSVREADGVRIIKQQTELQGNVILERLPAAPGVYILTVQVRTAETTITYYFRVVVQG